MNMQHDCIRILLHVQAAREVVLELFEGEAEFHMITKKSEFEVFVRIVELPVADKLRDLRYVSVVCMHAPVRARARARLCLHVLVRVRVSTLAL